MHIAIPAQSLKYGGTFVSALCGPQAGHPELAHMLIEADPSGAVTLSGTDLTAVAKVRLQAKVEGEGSLCLPAKLASKAVELAPPEASIAIQGLANGHAGLAYEAAGYRFSAVTAESYPKFAADEGEARLSGTVDSEELAKALAKILHAAPETGRSSIQGILIELDPTGAFRAIACDGARLAGAIVSLSVSQTCPDRVDLPMGERAVQRLAELAKRASGPVELKAGSNWIGAKTTGEHDSGLELAARALGGKYPDWRKVIRKESPTTVLVDRSEMLGALARLRAAGDDPTTGVELKTGGLMLEAAVTGTDAGSGSDMIGAEMSGPAVAVRVNTAYLTEAIKAAGSKRIKIGLAKPGEPIVIAEEEGLAYISVVMPIRA